MRIIRFAVDRPVTVLMIFTAVLVFGMVSVSRLSLNLLPDVSYPSLTLQTEYPDAAPAEVENLVTRPLEEAVGVVPGLKRIRSTSRPGLSEITLEFGWDTDMDYASLDVREKVDLVQLPDDSDSPVLLRFDPALDPIMRIGIYTSTETVSPDGMVAGLGSPQDFSLIRLRFYTEEILKKQLEPVVGVASAKVLGGLEEEIQVRVDERRLASLGVSIMEVTQRLGQENINVSGGRVREREAEYLLRTQNEFIDLSDIAETVLHDEEGRKVKLGDVATIHRGYKEQEIISRIEGKEAVEIAIYKEGDANTVAVAERVRAKLERISAFLPEGMHTKVLFDQSRFIRGAIGEVFMNAVLGGFLAILILFVFLREFRSTLTIGVSIPLSILATFIIMGQMGVSLNLMSLGGLALGVGMLVDNSIVVLESIARKRSQGMERSEATVVGGTEVGRAVIASTLTTIAVFLPIIFVEGMAGQFFKDQALTVSASLLASLAVSLLVIPTLSSWSRGRRARGVSVSMSRTGGEGPSEPIRTNGALGRDEAASEAGPRGVAGLVSKVIYWAMFLLSRPIVYPYRLLRLVARRTRVNRLGKLIGRGLAKGGRLSMKLNRGIWLFVFRSSYLLVRTLGRMFALLAYPFVVIVDAVFTRGIQKRYPSVLRWALSHRFSILFVLFAALFATLQAAPKLGRELVPPFAQGEFTFNAKLPEGSPLSETDRTVGKMENILVSEANVRSYFASVGTSDRAGSAVLDKEENRAQIYVQLNPNLGLDEEEQIIEDLRNRFASIPGLDTDSERPATFTLSTPVEVEIFGHSLRKLKEVADEIAAGLGRIEGLRDVRTSLVDGHPEIQIIFDRERISQLGLDLGQIAGILRNKVRGDVATRLREYDRQIDILVRSYNPDEARLRDVAGIIVGHVDGVPITLGNVAEIYVERGPSQIDRRSQQRAVVVSANLAGRDLGSAAREIESTLRSIPLPSNVSVALGGQNKELQSSFNSLYFAIGLAVFLVYLVMASQFESLIHPFIIMFTVPLALIGVVATLFAFGESISVVVLIGCIMLAGIVVNNGIVLIDYMNQLRRKGVPKIEAIVTAGETRLRPIVMTTLTTVLALTPMALGLGEGAEIRAPMALTVIGGLLVSAALTLFVIPILYTIVDRKP